MNNILKVSSNIYNNKEKLIYPAQLTIQNFGMLQVRCVTEGLVPIENALVRISSPANPGVTIGEFRTNRIGLTEEIELPTPSIDYSMEPGTTVQPYSEYDINIEATNFAPVTISNAEILPNVTSLQEATLTPVVVAQNGESYVIPPHTLYGEYPPKIAEAEVKPRTETGEIVLTQVVVPEFIIVHDGAPTDTTAKDYYVGFRDYIKNVASSEIYATWPDATIRANVLAILSFTLNRVYTEWYRSRGYNFTITSSTAFDHKWIPGRNIFANIGLVVDEMFVNYLSRPNVRQPIFTQYCDGYRVQCPNWMTQWGSKTLGDQGLSAIEILRRFYGASIFINTAPIVSGVPSSWPGYNLGIGTSGDNVRTIQQQLNRISDNYPIIPKLAVDGQYGKLTSGSVRAFQEIFNLPQTGVVDRATWYKISAIYVGVSRIAELS
jgi:peptidoglycan hydrolase-like protein with peptidoglycan-binding domain